VCLGRRGAALELHARGATTLLVFTHAEDGPHWLACLDHIEELATGSVKAAAVNP